MQQVLAIFGVLALVLFGMSISALRSDIQIILAAIGLFSAIILFGLAEVLRVMPRRPKPPPKQPPGHS